MKNPNQFYMKIALQVAWQSYAEKKKVGAILVKGDNILSFGYNGTPHGFDNKCEELFGEPERQNYVTKREVLHAESNAILKCAKSGSSTDGSLLFVTMAPCIDCVKLIIQAGIRGVYYLEEYRDVSGLVLLAQAGIYSQQIIL